MFGGGETAGHDQIHDEEDQKNALQNVNLLRVFRFYVFCVFCVFCLLCVLRVLGGRGWSEKRAREMWGG